MQSTLKIKKEKCINSLLDTLIYLQNKLISHKVHYAKIWNLCMP